MAGLELLTDPIRIYLIISQTKGVALKIKLLVCSATRRNKFLLMQV